MDLAAKAAHNLPDITEAPQCKADKTRLLKRVQTRNWHSYWIREMDASGKGRFLYKRKRQISYWSWTEHRDRRVETGLARIRMGHAGVNSHMHRFNMSDTDMCDCGEVETIEHYLFQCPKFTIERSYMYLNLTELNVEMTIKNILGGGTFTPIKQKKITDIMAKYLKDTNFINDI